MQHRSSIIAFEENTVIPTSQSLHIQRKIAAILTAYDDLIETNKRRIALLEKMAEELYREWFVRMRFPGHQNTKFVKGVPEGWDAAQIREIVRFTDGGKASKSNSRDIGRRIGHLVHPLDVIGSVR